MAWNQSQNQGGANWQHISQNRGNRLNLSRDNLHNRLSNRDGDAYFAYRVLDSIDQLLLQPTKSNPVTPKIQAIQLLKYDGKIDPKQWLRFY